MGSDSLAYIGLAYRAGRTLTGTAAVEKGIKQGKIRLLLLQDTLSEQSLRHFAALCEKFNVTSRVMRNERRIGAAIGKDGIMVLGITDIGFADMIRNIIDGV